MQSLENSWHINLDNDLKKLANIKSCSSLVWLEAISSFAKKKKKKDRKATNKKNIALWELRPSSKKIL